MEPSLKEKQAFFEHLDACRNCDDESDALSTEEQAMRQKCKAFFATAKAATAPAPRPPALPSSRLKLQGPRHGRTASDPTLRLATDGLEIIAVTPRDKRPAAAASSPVLGAPVDESIIPETEQKQNNKRAPQRRIEPSTRVLRSQSNLEPSPSVSMVKRKRNKPLQMAPESQQIFRGLRFYYIPNDDINPARRMRITKAQEYGATWTKDTREPTHVVVDKDLTYADVELIFDKCPSSAVLVNDQYPIECIRRGVVFDPNPTVERYQYKVQGDPGLPLTKGPTAPQPPSTQESNPSLQIKARGSARNAANSMSGSSQRSSDLIPSSYPEPQSPTSGAKPTDPAGSREKSGPSDAGSASTFTDELITCIDAVLDDPEKHQYLDESDTDARESEDEGPSTKKAKGRPRAKRNDATEFGKDTFMCMRGGTKDKKRIGPNADTIKLLEEMVEEHNLSGETWRVHSYRKAIATLRRQPKKITTAKEAAALPNIGASLAGHIEEIATTGRFEKLDRIRAEPAREALRRFCDVYGAGIPTAQKWVELGYRTLDDLRTKAKLTASQQIGLEHYEDLLLRIPRAEVTALGDHVKDAAAAVDGGVEIIVGGSYRRGADSSGDIDLILTKAGTASAQDLVPFLDELVETLTKSGFLTAALAAHRQDGGNKWHGCCVLPETAFLGPKGEYRPTWRRIDLLLVPETEIGAALVYFTGNDLFNRSMRLLARKKKMKLNHRALSGVGVHEGRDERKIFEILGVKWREPHERWC
ncbi:hypothetical protein F5Y10DRAFT_255897 [Nemania abortiva]|nr:hypothetical protein F5Y10DRAFT_255897 [Nemania abortiva]